MSWNFVQNVPVFMQITDAIKLKILVGEYPPNAQIPSVRAIAEQAGVNPNTVQRSLTMLEQQGLIVTKGTVGRFVTNDVETVRAAFDGEVSKEIDAFLERMKVYGVTAEKVIEILKKR